MSEYDYLVKHYPDTDWAGMVRDLIQGIHQIRPKEPFTRPMAEELLAAVVIFMALRGAER